MTAVHSEGAAEQRLQRTEIRPHIDSSWRSWRPPAEAWRVGVSPFDGNQTKEQRRGLLDRGESATDTDLRPLAWLILKMMRLPDDGNTAAYAATMAGYLGLSDFEVELEGLLKSRHPAVRRSARNALSVLRGK